MDVELSDACSTWHSFCDCVICFMAWTFWRFIWYFILPLIFLIATAARSHTVVWITATSDEGLSKYLYYYRIHCYACVWHTPKMATCIHVLVHTNIKNEGLTDMSDSVKLHNAQTTLITIRMPYSTRRVDRSSKRLSCRRKLSMRCVEITKQSSLVKQATLLSFQEL